MPDFDGTPIDVKKELEGIGDRMNALAGEIEHDLDTLRTRLQPLIDAWIAESATEYQTVMNQWDQSALALFGTAAQGGVLGTIATMMHVNWINYMDAEQANRTTWAH
ncbi:hypothetical protein GCM10010129_77080 [Streptomyces fumigatiscleroticus]|nr:hypothetical protein GCM10010129_77080 [Streptomyces fumigatiscleroticus]